MLAKVIGIDLIGCVILLVIEKITNVDIGILPYLLLGFAVGLLVR